MLWLDGEEAVKERSRMGGQKQKNEKVDMPLTRKKKAPVLTVGHMKLPVYK